ncbi:TORTIFOLIA1-like protein 5 [Rutidosis leptorrhynchoides]|uniref:TORTIFOLIA1-like protein 5 n=1 Tax=Rutidosis leptorrhynchoides TaxID=125765 RepID=UPI003A992C8D
MSLSKRVSLPPQSPPQPQQDLKHRVITCLNKLSDRDTLAVATKELESIVFNLTDDTFAPFLTYVSSTSSSDKSPVRRQCVRILGVLSVTHGDALSPHVSKMLAAVVRRLRDPDSAVRTACVGAVTSIASEITTPSFSSLSKPLVEAVMTEQDQNSQIGSALCLSAAIEASPDPEPVQLQKLLPRVLKMLKSDGFKAKPALLSVIGSIAGAGGTGLNRSFLNSLIPCLVEFLSSDDWAARKAAVEALGRLAVTEKDQLIDFRSSCLSSLENKRFDKVKVVRESMNRTLGLWKDVPGNVDEVPASPQLKCKSALKVPVTIMEASLKEKVTNSTEHSLIQRSSPTTTPSRSPPQNNYKKHNASIARKVDFDKEIGSKVNVPVPKPVSVEVDCKEKFTNDEKRSLTTVEANKNVIIETEKRVISGKTKFGSRVVPFIDDCELDMKKIDNSTEYGYANQKEIQDISRIQKQLVQIETQQSNLLNLLQNFIGNSRSGMNSLETRVNGLEKALDEISYDLAISMGRVPNTDACCMSTEFLSPKYWWRAESSSFSSPRSPFRGTHQLPKDYNPAVSKLGSPTALRGGFGSPGRSLEPLLIARNKKAAEGTNRNFDRFDGGSMANCVQQRI